MTESIEVTVVSLILLPIGFLVFFIFLKKRNKILLFASFPVGFALTFLGTAGNHELGIKIPLLVLYVGFIWGFLVTVFFPNKNEKRPKND
jgi:hypothetical protein